MEPGQIKTITIELIHDKTYTKPFVKTEIDFELKDLAADVLEESDVFENAIHWGSVTDLALNKTSYLPYTDNSGKHPLTEWPTFSMPLSAQYQSVITNGSIIPFEDQLIFAPNLMQNADGTVDALPPADLAVQIQLIPIKQPEVTSIPWTELTPAKPVEVQKPEITSVPWTDLTPAKPVEVQKPTDDKDKHDTEVVFSATDWVHLVPTKPVDTADTTEPEKTEEQHQVVQPMAKLEPGKLLAKYLEPAKLVAAAKDPVLANNLAEKEEHSSELAAELLSELTEQQEQQEQQETTNPVVIATNVAKEAPKVNKEPTKEAAKEATLTLPTTKVALKKGKTIKKRELNTHVDCDIAMTGHEHSAAAFLDGGNDYSQLGLYLASLSGVVNFGIKL